MEGAAGLVVAVTGRGHRGRTGRAWGAGGSGKGLQWPQGSTGISQLRGSDTSTYMAIFEREILLQVSGRYFIRSDSSPPEATH